MSLKKIFLLAFLFLVIFGFGFTTVKAMTESEKQILINQIIQQIANLQTQLNAMIAAGVTDTSYLGTSTTSTSGAWCHTFLTNMRYGDSGTEVGFLQQALVKEGLFLATDTEISSSFYGNRTLTAVKNFQEKYRAEILTANGLTSSTGVTASATRSKLNKIYGCLASVSTSSCNPVWACSGFTNCVGGQHSRSCYQSNCSSLSANKTDTQPCDSSSSSSTNTSCTPLWNYGNWGTCSNYSQTRVGTQYNCSSLPSSITETQYCDSNTSSSSTSTSCTPLWTYTSWGVCLNYSQSRVRTQYNCSSSPSTISETQYCDSNTSSSSNTSTTCTPTWGRCTDWSTCLSNSQNRTCYQSNCSSQVSSRSETQACTPACSPIWNVSNWSICSNGLQNRTAVDYANCNITYPEATSRACVAPAVTIYVNGVADRAEVYSADSFTISWTATNAVSCYGDFTSNTGTTGSVTAYSSVSKSYSITCQDAYGTTAQSMVSIVVSEKPSLSIGAALSGTYGTSGSQILNVSQGTAIKLFWNGSYTLSNCVVSGDWSSPQISYAGSQEIGVLSQAKTYTYTISCMDTRGGQAPVTASASVIVAGQSMSFTAIDLNGSITASDNITVPKGTSITLNWTTSGVHSCTAGGNWTTGVNFPTSGSANFFNLASSQIYNLSCIDNYSNSVVTKTVTVNITTPSVDLKVTKAGEQATDGPITLPLGSSATLTWTSSNDTYCGAFDDWSGQKNLTNLGGESTGFLNTAKTYTYTLICKDALNNDKTDKVSIIVQ